MAALTFVAHMDENSIRPTAEPCRDLTDGDVYRDTVWQLTELVVASGLPPEVDHHVFSLHVPGGLQAAWQTLERRLPDFGRLSLDVPLTTDGGTAGMTLHFPALPGMPERPDAGDTRSEGAEKIRFFFDTVSDKLYVVPMSFPAIDLPAGTPTQLSPEECRDRIGRWAAAGDAIGELLVAEATTRDAEVIFRALSICSETELVRCLTRVLASE